MDLRVTPRDSRAVARAKLAYLAPAALVFSVLAGVIAGLREWAEGVRDVWQQTPTE